MTRCSDCGMKGFHLGDCPQREGNDAINPKHYTHISGVETIQVNRAMSFDVGNAFKYVLRHQDKGNPLQDLTKARWYIGDAVKHASPIWNHPGQHTWAAIQLTKMWEAEPDPAVRSFFRALLNLDLVLAGDVVDAMIGAL